MTFTKPFLLLEFQEVSRAVIVTDSTVVAIDGCCENLFVNQGDRSWCIVAQTLTSQAVFLARLRALGHRAIRGLLLIFQLRQQPLLHKEEKPLLFP